MSDSGRSPPPADDEPYLWDRSGPADPDVADLERLLAPLAHRAPLRALPAPRRRKARGMVGIAVATLAIAAGAGLFLRSGGPKPSVVTTPPVQEPQRRAPCELQTPGSFAFSTEGGSVRCGAAQRASGWMPVDETLETHEARAKLEVASLGTVALEPNTKLRLIAPENDVQTLDLMRGTMHAKINAPPRRFVVRTPLADAVDLGCEYTLSVEEDGRGRLSVSYGAVSLERSDRASTLVTQGASCAIGAKGPGTPLADGTNPTIRAAAADLDAGEATAFDRLLVASTAQDTLTLWHVMRRIAPDERGRAYDRLATFVPPPPKAPRDAVVRGDHAAIAAYREALVGVWFSAPPKK
jgi:ferric-dicitrate binding protein FerR (iron transport regulator)